jgi:hypothetical protein
MYLYRSHKFEYELLSLLLTAFGVAHISAVLAHYDTTLKASIRVDCVLDEWLSLKTLIYDEM